MTLRSALLRTIFVSALIPAAAMAGDPTAAVSDTTATMIGLGGSADGRATEALGGSVSMPVTHAIGAQLDASLSRAGTTNGGDAGVHLFTRDPESYLVGTTFEWTRFGNTSAFRYGVEGAAYLGDFNLGAAGGLQRGGGNKGATSAGFASLQADYYVDTRLKTSIAFGGYSSYRTVLGEVEWQPSQTMPFSMFLDAGAAVATEKHGIILAGLRYTFGAPASTIKDRDRHGDPEPLLISGTTSGGLVGNTTALQGIHTAPAAAPDIPG